MFAATGIGPYCGQAIHFKHFALAGEDYANQRYQFEAARHFSIVDARLAKSRFMVGGVYSIVDMDVWGWARLIPYILGEGAWARFPNLKRLHDEIAERPAAERAVALRATYPFKTEWDDAARAAMFQHIGRPAA